MDTTVTLYVALLVAFLAATVYLIVRDLNASAERERKVAEQEKPTISTLPFAGEQTQPEGITGRIDSRFYELVHQSGIDIAPEPAFLLFVFIGLLCGGGVLLWRDDLLAACFGFAGGFAAPLVFFLVRRNQRIKQMRELLPGSMDMMARAVRAGETLDQAFDAVGQGTVEPLGLEWRRASRQLEMGLSVPAAMKSMSKRVPLMELRILGTALNVQRRTGGNLAVTLDRMSHVVRDRLSYQRQFAAATGASRMATVLIALAGPLVFGYMMMFQPDYMNQFFTLPGGFFLLGLAGVLQLVGLVWVYGLLKNNY